MVSLLDPEGAALGVGTVLLDGLGERLVDGLLGLLGGQPENGRVADLSGILQSVSRRVVDLALLGLAVLAREQDQLRLVRLEASDVRGLHLGALVVAAVVDGDADSAGEGRGQTGGFALREGEASAEAGLGTVPLGLAMHNGAELAERAREVRELLVSSRLGPNRLVSVLVKEAFDSPHPVLSQMGAEQRVIVFYHVAY